MKCYSSLFIVLNSQFSIMLLVFWNKPLIIKCIPSQHTKVYIEKL